MRYFILFIALFFCAKLFSQQLCIIIPKVPVWGQSVGILYSDSLFRDSIGTGFVISRKNYVMTSAHVIKGYKNIYFIPILDSVAYQLIVVKIDFEKDLALLSCHADISNSPLMLPKSSNCNPGDTIYYIGYNTKVDGCCVHSSTIISVGKTQNYYQYHKIDDFFEFNGEGIPGYSGGPVINQFGEVIGIMKESWWVRPFRSPAGAEVIRNISYSILPFRNLLSK